MTSRIANFARTALYLAAVVLMIHSAGVIMDSYAQLHELASTGGSAYGKAVSDLPTSLDPYVWLLLGAAALGVLGECVYRRYGVPKGSRHAA